MSKLLASKSGATAAIFALAVPVMVGGLAFAVDIGYYRVVQNRMQIAVDGGALAGVVEIQNGGDVATTLARAKDYVSENIPAEFGEITTEADIALGVYDSLGGFREAPEDPDMNAIRVSGLRSPGRGNPAQQFFSQFFGVDRATIGATAIAARPTNVWYQPPESMNLPPEAGDFNELYVYCYNTETSEIRDGTMTLISNNLAGESVVSMAGAAVAAAEGLVDPPAVRDLVWPRCNQRGETLSFRMRNFRHAKSQRQLWANPNATIGGRQPGRPEINYYTDTTLDSNGVETFNTRRTRREGGRHVAETPIDGSGRWNLIETVLCETEEQCGPPGSAGSIIPSGRNRNPRLASEPCEPGKFMYFGWEDRPPAQAGSADNWLHPAWTDRDFDDIVVRMRCPASGRLGDAYVRLVR
jgi:hypothetical protein